MIGPVGSDCLFDSPTYLLRLYVWMYGCMFLSISLSLPLHFLIYLLLFLHLQNPLRRGSNQISVDATVRRRGRENRQCMQGSYFGCRGDVDGWRELWWERGGGGFEKGGG